MAIESRNPATGELLKRFDPLSPSEVEERLARAHLVATQALFVDHFDDEVVDAAATKRS